MDVHLLFQLIVFKCSFPEILNSLKCQMTYCVLWLTDVLNKSDVGIFSFITCGKSLNIKKTELWSYQTV